MAKLEGAINSTSVLSDIRNFSETFKKFQADEDANFLIFLSNYFRIQKDVAEILSDNYYQTTTGDGVLSVFMDDDNDDIGYTFLLVINKITAKLCEDFNSKFGTKLSYGIGADNGNVWKIDVETLDTYVGTVINRAARLESKTKEFCTNTAVGNSLYKKLLKKYYPSAHETTEQYVDYDTLTDENPEVIFFTKKFLLQYASDMVLKGIQQNAPVFRISKALERKEERYWSVVEKLVGKAKTEKINTIFSKLF